MINRIVLPGTAAAWTVIMIILHGERFGINSWFVFPVIWFLGMACIITTGLYFNEKQNRPTDFKVIGLTDELTGLNNRRAFFAMARQQMEWGERFSEKALVIFIRLNELEKINDGFGPEERDFALIMVAQALLSSFRGSDIIARYSEDGFIAFLPESTQGFRDMIVARIKKSVGTANRKITEDYRLSIEIGAAEFDPVAPVSLENLIKKAKIPPPV